MFSYVLLHSQPSTGASSKINYNWTKRSVNPFIPLLFHSKIVKLLGISLKGVQGGECQKLCGCRIEMLCDG